MLSPTIQVRGWKPAANPMSFIHIVREAIGVDLRTAKEWLDRLRAGESINLAPLDEVRPKRVGEQLLRFELVEEAVLITEQGPETIVVSPPPPPPRCPACNSPLKHHFECSHCDWLRYPGNHQRWGCSGACPQCGFGYRWDGTCCSHCGYGAESK